MKQCTLEEIKQSIAVFGYNRYVQNVVCEYFVYRVSRKDLIQYEESYQEYTNRYIAAKNFFNDLKCKKDIEERVIPFLKTKYKGYEFI